MALGSTQPLVKMSTRNIPGGKGSRCVRLTTPPPCAECHEMWEPKLPGTLWATPGLFTGLLYLYFCVTFLFHTSLLLLDSVFFTISYSSVLSMPTLHSSTELLPVPQQYHVRRRLNHLEVAGLRNRWRRSWTPSSARVELLLAAKYRGVQQAKRTMYFFVTYCKLSPPPQIFRSISVGRVMTSAELRFWVRRRSYLFRTWNKHDRNILVFSFLGGSSLLATLR
jgi:hypothetical protein